MAITTTLQSCDALACVWVIGGTNARISYWEVAAAWVTRCFICSVVHLDLVEIYMLAMELKETSPVRCKVGVLYIQFGSMSLKWKGRTSVNTSGWLFSFFFF